MKKVIPYHPELRELLPSLGFADSTSLFIYLRNSSINFEYDRICTSEDRIDKNIKELNGLYEDLEGKSFIFIMDTVNIGSIDVICLCGISKEEMIRYLQLKVFS